MNEKVISQLPGLAVVRTRGKLVWVDLYVSGREFGIIDFVVEPGRIQT